MIKKKQLKKECKKKFINNWHNNNEFIKMLLRFDPFWEWIVTKVNHVEKCVMPEVEFTPIVAHVVIKSEITELLLEELCRAWKNEIYIDYEQSLLSYKVEHK